MTGDPGAKGAPHPSTDERAQGQDVLGLGAPGATGMTGSNSISATVDNILWAIRVGEFGSSTVDLYTATGEPEVGVPAAARPAIRSPE